jgi:ankyrin repeat protein
MDALERLLAAPDIDINARDKSGGTALMAATFYAVCEGDVKPLEKLLTVAGVDVNAQDEYGNTALIKTVGYLSGDHSPTVLEELLAVPGIDVNIEGQMGSPLRQAAEHGNVGAVERLMTVPNIDLGRRSQNEYLAEAKSQHERRTEEFARFSARRTLIQQAVAAVGLQEVRLG